MAELVSKEESKALSQVDELRAASEAAVHSARESVQHAVRAGEILNMWKETLPHGMFGEYRDKHFPHSQKTANKWMKAAAAAKVNPGLFLVDDTSLTKLITYSNDQPSTAEGSTSIGGVSEEAVTDAEPSPLEQLDEAVAEKVEQAIDQGLVPAPESSNGELSRGIEALRQYEETSQDELVQSVLDGRQTWDQAISTGEIPEPSIEDVCAAATSEIERFCRYLWKEWDDKMPSDPWLDHLGRRGLAKEQLKKALGTIRAAKTKPCPACDGQGCKSCQETGRVDGMTFKQLAGAKNS